MGTNGIPAIEALHTREKCPEAPTKRKFKTRALAEAAAKERSAETRISIVAYACSGCGYFHLTKKVDGSDIIHDDGKAIVTPGMRKLTAVPTVKPIPMRNWEVFPKVPGNAAARTKMFREFIDINPGPLAVATVMEALDCGVDTARSALREAGYTSKRGPGAKWEPPTEPPVEEQSTDGWRTPTSLPSHITIDDYVRAMKGVGLVVRIQVRDE